MKSLSEVLSEVYEEVKVPKIVKWYQGLSDEDRESLNTALKSDLPTSVIWRACRESGAVFDRQTLSNFRRDMP